MWNYEKRLQYPISISTPNAKMASFIISQYGGPDGEMGASMRYLAQRFSFANPRIAGVLTDIGTEELGHLEMIGAIVRQLTRGLSAKELEASGFAPYYIDHTAGVWPQAAGGVPFSATEFQSSGDAIADLVEDMAAEQKARKTYVNTKNAVDFICEKYHVRNAKELEFLYGQYQEEAREKETFRKTSDDLDYYTQNLLQYLTRLRMYDTRVWLTHANALVDSREMVELKHELLTRRQKLRARMEYSVGSIHEMKGEALKNMSKLGNNAYQLEQIIRKIEAMNPVFK